MERRTRLIILNAMTAALVVLLVLCLLAVRGHVGDVMPPGLPDSQEIEAIELTDDPGKLQRLIRDRGRLLV